MKNKGVTISELPLDIKAAEAAANEGQYVVVSAQNIIDAESGNGNMSTIDAVKKGFANILCSDNVPSSIINAVFDLHYKHGVKLYDAVNMATINPAKASGIDDKLGSIECGKQDDFVLVGDGIPYVDQMFVKGKRVLCMERNYLVNHRMCANC